MLFVVVVDEEEEEEVEMLVVSIGGVGGGEVFAVVLSILTRLFGESLVGLVDDELCWVAVCSEEVEPADCHLFTGSACLCVTCWSRRKSRVAAWIFF